MTASRRARERTELPFPTALELARRLSDDLAPEIIRSKVVGSLRRQVSSLTEIDLLVEPRPLQVDMFGPDGPDLQPIRAIVSRWGTVEKSGDRYMKVVLSGDAGFPDGFPVDLFLCHPPAEWGSLLAIRTGPVELATRAVNLLRARGLRHEDGRVVDAAGKTLPTPDEETFFALAGLPCVRPKDRARSAAMVPLDEPAPVDVFERRDAWERPRVLDPERTRALAEEGIAKVAGNSEALKAWLRGGVESVARRLPRFTADDVWEALGAGPEDRSAGSTLGSVMRAAKDDGLCELVRPAEYRTSNRPETHGRPLRVWASKVVDLGEEPIEPPDPEPVGPDTAGDVYDYAADDFNFDAAREARFFGR